MDGTLYEKVDPDVTIRRLAKKLYTLLWLKHGLITTLPPPGPASPQRINDIVEKITKSVLVYSYATRPVLQYYMEKHSHRIGQSKIAFWTHVSFLCLRIRLVKDNLFDYFLNTCSIIAEVALFCNWEKLDDVHTYASTFFAAFFESELSGSFFGAGGWAGLLNYIEDVRLLELYEGVAPYRNEMKFPCNLVPIMITVTSEALSAERRERIASARELKAEEIERFEPVRLLTAKIFNWDFMEQLHISSLKPGVFKRVANIRRKSKKKTVYSDLSNPLCSRQLYITGGGQQEAAGNSVFQMNSSPNLRPPEYDTPLKDTVIHRSISVNDEPTSSLQASSICMNEDSKAAYHRSISEDNKLASSLQASSSWMNEDSKAAYHRSVSVDDKLASSLQASSSWMNKDSKAAYHRSVSVVDELARSLQASSMKEDIKAACCRSVSVDDKPVASSFLISPSWLTAQETKYKCPASKLGILKDDLKASFKSSQSITSTVAHESQVNVNDSPKETSEISLENRDNVELSTNIQSECCENVAINVNTTQFEANNNSSNDTFLPKHCILDSKANIHKTARIYEYSSDVQIGKGIPFEKQAHLSMTDPKPKTLFDPKIYKPCESMDPKCDSANAFSTSSRTLSKESVSNSDSSCNQTRASTSFTEQAETKHSSNNSLERQSKKFTEMKRIYLPPEASASTSSITNNLDLERYETVHTLRNRYQSFEFTADGAESVTVKPDRTVHYKKRLFGTSATRKYTLKQSVVNDIEYLESLNMDKRISVNVPGAKQKVLATSETTESENESLHCKNSSRDDEKIKELVKALEKSGVSKPVVFKI